MNCSSSRDAHHHLLAVQPDGGAAAEGEAEPVRRRWRRWSAGRASDAASGRRHRVDVRGRSGAQSSVHARPSGATYSTSTPGPDPSGRMNADAGTSGRGTSPREPWDTSTRRCPARARMPSTGVTTRSSTRLTAAEPPVTKRASLPPGPITAIEVTSSPKGRAPSSLRSRTVAAIAQSSASRRCAGRRRPFVGLGPFVRRRDRVVGEARADQGPHEVRDQGRHHLRGRGCHHLGVRPPAPPRAPRSSPAARASSGSRTAKRKSGQ